MARRFVEADYDIFFPFDEGHNSRDALQYTANSVEEYLEEGRFLRAEAVDTEVNVSALTDLYLTIGIMTGAYEKHSTQSHR